MPSLTESWVLPTESNSKENLYEKHNNFAPVLSFKSTSSKQRGQITGIGGQFDRNIHHGKPDIVNSDQGSQFTCAAWIKELKESAIQISMDGRGRATDNAHIERLWRSVKYDYVYLKPPADGYDLSDGLKQYFRKYNYNLKHQGINRVTPSSLYHISQAA